MTQSLLKARVVKHSRTIWGKRSKNPSFVAQIGNIGATAPTKVEVLAKVEGRVLDALARLGDGVTIVEQHGLVGIIFPTPDGWSHQIVGSHAQGPDASVEEAEFRLRHHMAQNAWSMEVEDDVVFLNQIQNTRAFQEMEGWVRWQRAFLDIRADRPDLPNDVIHGMASSQLGQLKRAV